MKTNKLPNLDQYLQKRLDEDELKKIKEDAKKELEEKKVEWFGNQMKGIFEDVSKEDWDPYEENV